MKLGVTLDILNQKDTPAFYADTLANRPAAGFTGRVFISTDTLDLYRDTGTTWVLLSPSSTGTITGSGAAGQVTYFSAASSITGSNDLFFDSVNGHLGIGTITPSTALTIFHDQNQIIQINQTTATNDTKIAFQNSGTPLWRIGNSYNAGANDWGIYDVVGSIQPLTIKKTTGQTFIGSQTTSSGLLVVNSSTADNQIVAIGANSPSIRVRNAGTAPTQQFGLGLSTATNNFIQGSASGDFCIFNGSTTASPILFGINSAGVVNEAARVSAARNFLIGTTTDAGFKLDVQGTAVIRSDGAAFQLLSSSTSTQYQKWSNGGGNYFVGISSSAGLGLLNSQNAYSFCLSTESARDMSFGTNNLSRMTIFSDGNVGINTGATNAGFKLDVNGTGRFSGALSANSFIPTSSSVPTNGMYLSATNTLGFATNGTLDMVLDASGNLGLGVTNMSSYNSGGNQLVIGGGGFKGLTIAGTTEGNIYFADGTSGQDAYRGVVGYNHTTNSLFFYSDATERMRITSGGLVGIGTNAPNSLLEVNRTITFSGIDTYGQLVVKTTSGANGKLLNIGVDETNSVSFIQSLNRGTDAIPLSLQRYGGAVLIGTTTEGALGKLQVAGSVAITGQYNTVLPSSSFSYFDGSGQVVSSASSASALYLDTTWNTTGNPDGIYLNVANTASGASSKLLNLKVDNASKFSVAKDGTIAIGNSVAAGVAVSSTHKVSILIGGVQYYLLASNV